MIVIETSYLDNGSTDFSPQAFNRKLSIFRDDLVEFSGNHSAYAKTTAHLNCLVRTLSMACCC